MNEYDKIFYPDRSYDEIARFRREGKVFFEAVIRPQSVDRIFYPDRTPDEVARFRREGKRFFEVAIRRKPSR